MPHLLVNNKLLNLNSDTITIRQIHMYVCNCITIAMGVNNTNMCYFMLIISHAYLNILMWCCIVWLTILLWINHQLYHWVSILEGSYHKCNFRMMSGLGGLVQAYIFESFWRRLKNILIGMWFHWIKVLILHSQMDTYMSKTHYNSWMKLNLFHMNFLIGTLRWNVEMGRVDITFEILFDV